MEAWPSARDINVYWVEHSRDLPDGISTPVDWEEPSCFACGWYNSGRTCDTEPFKGLDRAHVIPRARGGTNELRNFALLCRECHEEAPDTTDPGWFWTWCAARPPNTPWHEMENKVTELLRLVRLGATDRATQAIETATQQQMRDALRRATEDVQPSQHFGIGLSTGTTARMLIAAGELLAADQEQETTGALF